MTFTGIAVVSLDALTCSESLSVIALDAEDGTSNAMGFTFAARAATPSECRDAITQAVFDAGLASRVEDVILGECESAAIERHLAGQTVMVTPVALEFSETDDGRSAAMRWVQEFFEASESEEMWLVDAQALGTENSGAAGRQAIIKGWVKADDEAESRELMRLMLEQDGWDSIKVEDASHLSASEVTDLAKPHYLKAVATGFAYVAIIGKS